MANNVIFVELGKIQHYFVICFYLFSTKLTNKRSCMFRPDVCQDNYGGEGQGTAWNFRSERRAP